MSARSEFIAGARATLPLVIGAIPFGVIFGASAVTKGISPAGALAMSMFVFAGSAQFIGANLYGALTPVPVIILTTFVVNLRHALYSATLAPHVRHLPQRWLIPLGFWLTDETFVVVANRYNDSDDPTYKHWFYLGSALFMYLNWLTWTIVGIVAGSSIENPEQWGLDFALIVTFIGMVVLAIKARPELFAVVVGGTVAVLAKPMPYNLGLIIAALCGVAAGVIAESLLPKTQSDAKPATEKTVEHK